MKNKLIIALSLIFSCVMFLTGCGSTTTSIFEETTDAPIEFHVNYMSAVNDYIYEKIMSKANSGNSDSYKLFLVGTMLQGGNLSENIIMAAVDCFNLTSEDSTKTTYYDIKDQRYKVEYVTSERVYKVTPPESSDMLVGEVKLSITKNDGIYNIVARNEEAQGLTATVNYNTSDSSMVVDITESAEGVTIKIRNEIISLKNGDIVYRAVITEGVTNNRNIYTIECYKKIFSSKIKVAKSNNDIGAIDKQNISEENFAKPSTSDVTGYQFEIDTSTNTNNMTTFGNLAEWVLI